MTFLHRCVYLSLDDEDNNNNQHLQASSCTLLIVPQGRRKSGSILVGLLGKLEKRPLEQCEPIVSGVFRGTRFSLPAHRCESASLCRHRCVEYLLKVAGWTRGRSICLLCVRIYVKTTRHASWSDSSRIFIRSLSSVEMLSLCLVAGALRHHVLIRSASSTIHAAHRDNCRSCTRAN